MKKKETICDNGSLGCKQKGQHELRDCDAGSKNPRRKAPPKGPGGTPKPDRKKKTKEPEMNQGDLQRQFALRQCYVGMRQMGHAPLVASAMMNAISNGFDLADIEDAMKSNGDI